MSDRRVQTVEIFISIVLIWWSIVLFTNDKLSTNLPALFERFAMIMVEWKWGVVFLVAALV